MKRAAGGETNGGVNLDELVPLQAQVGYGTLGIGGQLGYESKLVSVGGVDYQRALSTHPPARILYRLGGSVSRFRARVALNDDVPAGRSSADFAVLADGRELALERGVRAGDAAREVEVEIAGADLLELVVTTNDWEYCHAVWLDPELDAAPNGSGPDQLVDCLERATIELPGALPDAERCVATVASAGFESLLDDCLGSVVANGCPDALLVVFLVGPSPACEEVIARYRAVPIRCSPRAPVAMSSKAILYSAARVVPAKRFVCLDADTLVLDTLEPLFSALDALPAGSVLAATEGNAPDYRDLGDALTRLYGGCDLPQVVGESRDEERYPLVVNDGVFAGSRDALLALDEEIRTFPGAVTWADAHPGIPWRNQGVFNLALARLGCGVELASRWNFQAHAQAIELHHVSGRRSRAEWNGDPVGVLHLSGVGRDKHPEVRRHFSAARDPLAGAGDGDGYSAFLAALRGWIGRHGAGALAWSFYGTAAGDGAHVRDPSVFPLLAVLHYLLRANGCARVVETGTARGVSTACIASSIAHRQDARVVTFDIAPLAARDDLWDSLPSPMRACIDARTGDSCAGMADLFEAGERFDAALLDSEHTEHHVWNEWKLARKLVSPGGLVLVHDPIWAPGTVDAALRRIEDDGYGVVRLWTAESGVREDDGLGLALIENRRRRK